MTLEADNPALEDDELNTTAPQSKSDEWRMPDPVFRRTSGKLPEGFLKNEFETIPSSGKPSPPDEPAITEVMPSPPPSEVKPKNPTLKLVLVLLGLAAMTAFLVVFLTVLYFFFF